MERLTKSDKQSKLERKKRDNDEEMREVGAKALVGGVMQSHIHLLFLFSSTLNTNHKVCFSHFVPLFTYSFRSILSWHIYIILYDVARAIYNYIFFWRIMNLITKMGNAFYIYTYIGFENCCGYFWSNPIITVRPILSKKDHKTE